jgi:hypothetical protein
MDVHGGWGWGGGGRGVLIDLSHANFKTLVNKNAIKPETGSGAPWQFF